MRGFPSISPFLKPFGRRIGPPNPNDIDRRFKSRIDGTLIDSIAGRNATVLFPVSEFDGVDDVAGIGAVFGINANYFDFEITILSHSGTFNGLLVGERDGFQGIRTQDGNLNFYVFTSDGVFSYSDSNAGTYRVIANAGAFTVIRDCVIVHNSTYTGMLQHGDDIWNIGSIVGAISCHGFKSYSNLGDLELSIPLPHLGYGYDQNGDAVELAVSGGVSEGYDENGSRHLVEKGSVARNPELVTNGDFSLGADGWNDLSSPPSSVSFSNNRLTLFRDVAGADPAISQTTSNLVGGVLYRITLNILSATSLLNNIGVGVVGGNILFLSPNIGTLGKKTYMFTPNVSGALTIRHGGPGPSTVEVDFISATLATPDYIPNNDQGQPIVELVDGDTFISGTPFLNSTPFQLRLFTLGDTDVEYTFFDKSNPLIWKQTVRDSIYYDSGDTGLWHYTELTQQFIYDNIVDAEKYKWWIRLVLNQYKDLFFYNTALTGADICKAKKYVKLGESYPLIESTTQICGNDIIL